MFSDRNYLLLLILSLMIAAVSCGDITDDLFPSSKDKRPSVEAGTIGPAVGQNAPDFTVPDTNGDIVTLASAIADRKGAVFYFTMWCPICDSHMSHMMNATVPLYPDVRFFAVDYVSATIADARNAQIANGYAALRVLADIDHELMQGYKGTMGTTVVIDSAGIVKMNEDYRDGSNLQAVLAGLP